MRLARRLVLTALGGLVCSVTLAAPAERTLRLDAAASSLSFHLDATMHAARGTIAITRGEIRFDLESGLAGGEVVLDASSASTDHEGRDRKMHEEVLESARFPEIVFRPAAVQADLDERGTGVVVVTGVVSIHGGEHEVKVRAAVSRDGDRVRATGKLSVPYVAWGLHDPSVFVLRVAKVVEVSFSAVGELAAPLQAAAPGEVR